MNFNEKKSFSILLSQQAMSAPNPAPKALIPGLPSPFGVFGAFLGKHHKKHPHPEKKGDEPEKKEGESEDDDKSGGGDDDPPFEKLKELDAEAIKKLPLERRKAVTEEQRKELTDEQRAALDFDVKESP